MCSVIVVVVCCCRFLLSFVVVCFSFLFVVVCNCSLYIAVVRCLLLVVCCLLSFKGCVLFNYCRWLLFGVLLLFETASCFYVLVTGL